MKHLTVAFALLLSTAPAGMADEHGPTPWLAARSGMVTLLAAAQHCESAIPAPRVAQWFNAQGFAVEFANDSRFDAQVGDAQSMAAEIAGQLPPHSKQLLCALTEAVARAQGLQGEASPPTAPYGLDMPIADATALYRLGLVAASSVSCDANYTAEDLEFAMTALAPSHLRAPEPYLTSALGHNMAFNEMADARGSALCIQAAEAAEDMGLQPR